MLFKFALRNVMRNRRRSFLTALAIFFAGIIVGLAQGWINGMVDISLKNIIDFQTGHLRITTQEFADRERFMPVEEIILEADTIIKQLQTIPEIAKIEERIRFGILLGHKEVTVEAMGVGINLQDNVYNISEKLTTGKISNTGIYIGEGLAEQLGVKIGDKLLLATKTSEGGLNGIKLSINGIVKLGIGMYDKKFFFVSLSDAKRLLKIYSGTTEIYIFSKATKLTEKLSLAVKEKLPAGVIARTFQEQLGNMYLAIKNTKVIYAFIEIMILFLASFVVINTMMMAIFERLHEIGTLKALGMSDRELFINFTLEGAIIGAVGGILGALVGYIIIAILSYYGINLQSMLKDVDMPIEYVIHPTLSISALFIAIVMSIIVPALAAMLPAHYVNKLMPAEALRK